MASIMYFYHWDWNIASCLCLYPTPCLPSQAHWVGAPWSLSSCQRFFRPNRRRSAVWSLLSVWGPKSMFTHMINMQHWYPDKQKKMWSTFSVSSTLSRKLWKRWFTTSSWPARSRTHRARYLISKVTRNNDPGAQKKYMFRFLEIRQNKILT